MRIRINGKDQAIDNPVSIAQIISDKALSPEKIVVEHNYRITSKEEWAGIILQEKDRVEIVSFVGGG